VTSVRSDGDAVGQRADNEHHQQNARDDEKQEEQRRGTIGGVRRPATRPSPGRRRRLVRVLLPSRTVVPSFGRKSEPPPGDVGRRRVEVLVDEIETAEVTVVRRRRVVVHRTAVVLDELGLRLVRCTRTTRHSHSHHHTWTIYIHLYSPTTVAENENLHITRIKRNLTKHRQYIKVTRKVILLVESFMIYHD